MERKPLSELLEFFLYMQYVIVETLTANCNAKNEKFTCLLVHHLDITYW